MVITSVLRDLRPTVLPSCDTSDLQKVRIPSNIIYKTCVLCLVVLSEDKGMWIVLHPPNLTFVVRYFGLTRTWFSSSFKL